MIKYPYSKPEVTKSDINEVKKVLLGGYLSQGEKIHKFEYELSRYFDSKNAIVCNSGTAALHLIYMALGIGPKAGLLTTPITFLATANAAKMCNASVYFADVDHISGLLTADTIEKSLKKYKNKIKVITLVHLGGKICDLESISKVAKKYNCLIVEDASHAAGAEYYDKGGVSSKVGSNKYSIATAFSFNAIKHVAMGEGGCVSTNNKIIADKIKNLRSHGMLRQKNKLLYKPTEHAPWYYEMHALGWNYRADEVSCALGNSQLKRLDKNILKRNKIVNLYNKFLEENNYIVLPKIKSKKYYNAWHLYSISIDFKKIKITRGNLMNSLHKAGIGTQVHYIPLFMQPYYRDKKNKNFSGAIEYYNKTLSIPLYVQLKKKDIEFISFKLNKFIR